MDGGEDNEVFASEGDVVIANQFLHELPSYQSLVRRRPSNYGTMDSHKSNRNLKRSLSREPSRLESVDSDFSIPLKERPISIQEKRNIRKIQTTQYQNTTGWGQLKDNSRSVYRKFNDETADLFSNLKLWRGNIHSIEGKFGTGIGSYFSFLRFLVLLNFVIFLLMFCFTTLPVAISKQGIFNSSQTVLSNNEPPECTKYSPISRGLLYFYNNIIDFLSGTGFLELTYLFYGYYTIDTVTVSIIRYSLPLAYIMVTFAYLLLSIAWIVRRAVKGFKQSLVHEEDRFQSYCNKIFAGWDFCITDKDCADLKHNSLLLELKTDLEEENERQRKEKRTRRETLRIYALRLLINIIVIAVLSGCFYAIYLATSFSQEYTSPITQKADKLSLLIEYLPSIVITIANFITPIIFENIVQFEDYTPAFVIRFTLIRCVFVRLASIAVLLISLWTQITSCSGQSCKLCGYNYKDYPCWETRVGQEMYKLMMFDFLIIVAVTILVEFPRKLLVTYCSCRPVQWWGQQEFEIPANVLAIVYGQTICWIGTFYSPLLPAIATLKYFIVFYIKKITLMENCRPATRPFRASRSIFFFQVILLIGLVLACVPVGVGIASIPASKACGPFISYNTSWQIIPATVDSFPEGLKKFIYVIASESFAIPFFLLSCLVMFYFIALAGAHKKVVEQLQEQLIMESRDKMFLIRRLTEAHSSHI